MNAVYLPLTLVGLFFIAWKYGRNESDDNSVKSRAELLADEFKMAAGGNIELNEEETQVNNILMQWKHEEFDYWFANPEHFNFSKSFFEYKGDMEKSKVYRFIEKMPKGSLLHAHGSAILGPDFFMNITYRDHLYVCFEVDKMRGINWSRFKFSLKMPNDGCGSQWQLMSDVRQNVKNVKEFDIELRKNFTLTGTNHNNNERTVWNQFSKIFNSINSLINYRPMWEEYCYAAFKKLLDDKILYVEIRNKLRELYELDGEKHDKTFFVNYTINVIERFKRDHPDFFGVKLIGAYRRKSTVDDIKDKIGVVIDAKRKFPDFIAGFDLVANEDAGKPLIEFLPVLEEAKSELNFFFHAGETNWLGTSTDENLIDAILLGTKRIGHGNALIKHPSLLEEVKKRDICVEVNVISNSVLGYTLDARAHPLATFLARNVTSVVASDDPGLWEAPPLSADMYVTFMGVAGRRHDLRLLKQLTLNSIHCSALSLTEKQSALAMFHKQWNKFIKNFLNNTSEFVSKASNK